MNQLSTAERVRIISCLVEGVSQRAAVRMTGSAKKTVARLAVEIGEACEVFADSVFQNLQCQRIQCDEIWSFVGCKERQKKTASHVERQNLTMRMQIRRFTRLTNAFSKKLENHRLACALHFVHYNFCRIHQTLRVTPAMEAGLSDHVWTLEGLVGLLTAAKPALRAAA